MSPHRESRMRNLRVNPGIAACLLILTIPALLNIRETHDWGGDFALHIRQARNILLKLPQLQTGYIHTKELAFVAPPVYPVGLPLLLAPAYFFFGKSIYHFNLLISFFYLLFSWMTFWHFRRISNDILTNPTLTRFATLCGICSLLVRTSGALRSGLGYTVKNPA